MDSVRIRTEEWQNQTDHVTWLRGDKLVLGAPMYPELFRRRILGVDYHYATLPSEDEVYVTDLGRPFLELLLPHNHWGDPAWFQAHCQTLSGTSCVYRIETKSVAGRSMDLVFKWNRMGQDIPGIWELEDFTAEFNSPFEEFALLMELRQSCDVPGKMLTHKPLAIFVHNQKTALERLGRKEYKMACLQNRHADVNLDMHKAYAVIYEWVKGIDAVQAFHQKLIDEDYLAVLTRRSVSDLACRGFAVVDAKPHHLILRPRKDGTFLRRRNEQEYYALVDFELLQHTPQREKITRMAKRRTYLAKQLHRFEDYPEEAYPTHLKPVTIMGVDYVYGHVEATGGLLWVVGKDPSLFEYFLPERWREAPRYKLSVFDQLFHTTTKDDIQLIWRISRVGEMPDLDPFEPSAQAILDHGYNSPFEEVALALELNQQEVPSTYPRAIYMAAGRSVMHELLCDRRRYETHKDLLTPEGKPILRDRHDYILFWGYWNGPEELMALTDESPYHGIDALIAYRNGLIDKNTYLHLLNLAKALLAKDDIEDLNLRGSHILLSQDNDGELVLDAEGIPELRISNFELLRRQRA
jgi:hypothetical protein